MIVMLKIKNKLLKLGIKLINYKLIVIDILIHYLTDVPLILKQDQHME